VANREWIVLSPALVPIKDAKLATLCRTGRNVQRCGPMMQLDYRLVDGSKTEARTYTVKFTYGSKVFPAILASQEVDGNMQPLPAPQPTVAPPAAHQ
jgi:hypothetical protein